MNPLRSAVSSAIAGIKAGFESVAQRAGRIQQATAQPETSNVDLVGEMVGLKVDELQVKANQKVIKTTQELEKKTLDIIA